MSRSGLLVVAGEASGDLHGARLLHSLAELVPDLEPFGLGGDEMIAGGFEALAHCSEISVIGFAEVLKIFRRARQIFRRLLDEVDRRGTRAAVLIDFSGFNLRLAEQLHRRGVRILYYISPQVWATRPGRVRTIARTVERMLVVLPFEVDFYRRHGVEVTHVGHPLADEVPVLEQVWDRAAEPGEVRVLSLLPGSRRNEVRSLLPAMLATVRRLVSEMPLKVRLIQAPTVDGALFDELLEGCGFEVERIPRAARFTALAGSHLALCASGTATLEVGLLTTPLVVVYRVSRLTYVIGRMLVARDLPHFSMVNLILDGPVVPELAQGRVDADRLAPIALGLLRDSDKIAVMRRSLSRLRSLLGASGASRRAAAEVAEVLKGPS